MELNKMKMVQFKSFFAIKILNIYGPSKVSNQKR